MFLDISKAFDKVWHEGPIHKLELNGIGGPLNILTDFLKSRKQRVLLTGQHSSWSDVLASVPKGSILCLFCFLFTLMTYLMVFSVTQKCFQIIPHYWQQCIILTKPQMI